MFIRILSGIIGLIALLPLIIFGGLWLQIGLTIVVIIGMWEFYRAFGEIRAAHIIGLALAVAYIALIDNIFPGFLNLLLLPLLPAILLAVSYMAFVVMRRKPYKPIGDVSIAVFGFFYIAVTLSTIYILREGMGMFFVWLVFISAWGCDTGAYFTGRTLGRHKLAPVLSPNKTVEGFAGGIVTATLLGAAYGFILYNLGKLGFGYILIFALVAFVCSIAGQIGDLAASAIKRSRELKDYGNIMPGHGGVLDRFDSIIFTAPLAFVILGLIEWFINL